MAKTTPEDERPTRPFADFLLEHNSGVGHKRAGEALQRVVAAVVETQKKGSVTITVSVEPMKQGEDNVLVTAVNVTEKLPVTPPKSAVFYADEDANLRRENPRQPSFEGVKSVPEPAPVREVGDKSEAAAQ
jgi:hypothetical protein